VIFRQYELACLSQFSYLVGDEATGRAVVVDPQRDVTRYLDDAQAFGLHIERVIETHFHADFVSGHLELAAATGAVISYGQGAEADFPIDPLRDGEQLSLGAVTLEVRATPGHTPESISIVVYDRPGAEPWAVLTGDALFIGDVGRPDLLVSRGLAVDDLARALYRSLQSKILTLPDATRVYPAHGAGSACGKQLSAEVVSTIGEQRATNYALQAMTEDAFVGLISEGQPLTPPYFGFAADANRRVHELLDEAGPPRLDAGTLARLRDEGAVLVDSRTPEAFASGHIRGSINVPFEGRFAEFAGDVVRPGTDIVVIADEGREMDAKIRLGRIGFDRVVGAVSDVAQIVRERPELASTGARIAGADVAAFVNARPGVQVLDVRNPAELEAGAIPDAITIPLPALLARLSELDRHRPVLVYCGSDLRSSIAASVLRGAGFDDVHDIIGGYPAWRDRTAHV
jgi:hydroxyacylglutathione hydrolase